MKFSDTTLEVLKSFSAINPGIIIKEGNVLRTISPQKTIMASAKVPDTFEGRAGIYDLGQMLATFSLVEDGDIEFGDGKFIIDNGRQSAKFRYAAENVIVAPPEKDFGEFDDVVCKFSLTWENLDKLVRATGALQVPEIVIESVDGKVSVVATDTADPTSNDFRMKVETEENTDQDFVYIIKVENIKLLPGDYDITLSSKGVAYFESNTVRYWIAVTAV